MRIENKYSHLRTIFASISAVLASFLTLVIFREIYTIYIYFDSSLTYHYSVYPALIFAINKFHQQFYYSVVLVFMFSVAIFYFHNIKFDNLFIIICTVFVQYSAVEIPYMFYKWRSAAITEFCDEAFTLNPDFSWCRLGYFLVYLSSVIALSLVFSCVFYFVYRKNQSYGDSDKN